MNPGAYWLAHLFNPQATRHKRRDPGVRVEYAPKERDLRLLSTNQQQQQQPQHSVLVKLFSRGHASQRTSQSGEAQTASGLSTPSLLQPDSATQDGLHALQALDEESQIVSAAPTAAALAQASLCLAFLQQHVPEAGPRAAQAAMQGAENSCQQLLTVCRSGELICRLINALVPDTIDDRLISTLDMQQLQGDSEAETVAVDGVLLQETTSIALQDDWFKVVHPARAEATASAQANTLAADDDMALKLLTEQEEECKNVESDHNVQHIPGPAISQGQAEEDKVVWNWRLAHGSVVAQGCVTLASPPDTSSHVQVDYIVDFLLSFAIHHFTEILNQKNAPALRDVMVAGETEADLACLPLSVLVARWVTRQVSQYQEPAADVPCNIAHSATHLAQVDVAPMHPSSRRVVMDTMSLGSSSADADHQAVDALLPLANLTTIRLLLITLQTQYESPAASTPLNTVHCGGELLANGLNVLPDETDDAMVEKRLEQLLLAGQVVMLASRLGVRVPLQARWLVDGGPTVLHLLLRAIAVHALVEPDSTTVTSDAAQTSRETKDAEAVVARDADAAADSRRSQERDDTVQAETDDTVQTLQSGGAGSAFASALAAAQVASGSVTCTRRVLRRRVSVPFHDRASVDSAWPAVSRSKLRPRNGQMVTASISASGQNTVGKECVQSDAGVPSASPRTQDQGEESMQEFEDECTDRQEEKLLRSWLNALLAARGLRISSLFDSAMCTGWPLLVVCDVMAPGCIDWSKAYPPPFHSKRVPRKIMAVENGNQVCRVCTHVWHLPLVNIGGVDIAEGHRGALMSLVWQLMRHDMLLALGPLIPVTPPPLSPLPSTPGSPTVPTDVKRLNATPAPHTGLQRSPSSSAVLPSAGVADASGLQSSGSSIRPSNSGLARQANLTWQFRQIEEEVLRWANSKLTQHVSHVNTNSSQAWHLTGLNDPSLTNPQVWVRILVAVGGASAVNAQLVLPGTNARERMANARLVLSAARALGAKVYLAAEDMADALPRTVLILLAALMACDKSSP